MVDICIALAIVILTITLAGLGVYVTLHPVADTDVRKKTAYKRSVAICGFCICALIIWQGVRNKNSQEALTKALAKIDHNTSTPPSVSVNVPPAQIVIQPPQHPAIVARHVTPNAIKAASGATKEVPPPAPAYQQQCVGSACAQGPGSQATYNQFGKPEALLHTVIYGDKTPEATMVITNKNDWENVALVTKCERPCSTVSMSGLGSGYAENAWVATENPNWLVFKLLVPSMIPDGTVITWKVRSNDGQPMAAPYVQKANITYKKDSQ